MNSSLAGVAFSTWIPILFLTLVFLLGGGSRSDIASLPFLRAAAVLFAFWAALRMSREDWRRIRVPLALMLILILWMMLQLVPLPPDVWHALPGRETIVAIDRMVGEGELWRPLSLTPSQTLNALLAMSVPMAALLLAAQMTTDEYRALITAAIIIAGASALLGLVQILSGSGSPAYLYRIANKDSMIGFFSNRNHHAIFLACIIPLVAMLLRDESMRKRKRVSVRVGLSLAGVFFAILTILIGSRGGFAAGAFAVLVGYAIVVASWPRTDTTQGPNPSRSKFVSRLRYASAFLFMLIVSAALMVSGRTTAFTRLMVESGGDDLRLMAWPTVQSMIQTYWIAGSGFGSFASVYKMFEPDSLLRDAYFNHAHNDWAELLITGGLPFALIVVAMILWIGRTFLAHGVGNLIKGYRGDLRLPTLTVFLLLAATSLIDYPLRVPSLQALTVFLIVFLCCPKSSGPR